MILLSDLLKELAQEFDIKSGFIFNVLNDDVVNNKEYLNLINKRRDFNSFKLIGKYQGKYDIYRNIDGISIMDLFVDDDKQLIIFGTTYNMFGSNHVETNVWHHESAKGFASDVYKTYYFSDSNCHAITSDYNLSSPAFDHLWKGLVKYALDNGYQAYITNNNMNQKIPLNSENYEVEMNNNYVRLKKGEQQKDIPINDKRFQIAK